MGLVYTRAKRILTATFPHVISPRHIWRAIIPAVHMIASPLMNEALEPQFQVAKLIMNSVQKLERNESVFRCDRNQLII
jgi:hypothetical protein